MHRKSPFAAKYEPQARCNNCSSRGLKLFFSALGIPVHSCMLMSTHEEAVNYPRGDIELGYCPSCGFVTNILFESDVHEYSAQYEETQGFSPTFNAFARGLAQRLIDDWGLEGKSVLEIGCGKGEFVTELCERGVARGIGFDPSYVPDRNLSEAAGRIEFIRDFYSEKYKHVDADFVCCRHTLEHIAPTQEFMTIVRSAIDDRLETVVFFEVPDIVRVLREGAFWDIYYEHCSYFSIGSLARLFRGSNFDVRELWLDYDDQYVMLTALPTDHPTQPTFDLEDDLDELTRLVNAFPEVCGRVMDRWRDLVLESTSQGARVVLWGSGSKGVAFLNTLPDLSEAVEYVVDINPFKEGKYMPGTGQRIVSPQFLSEYNPNLVIAMNPIYREEIAGDLKKLGVEAECIAV